MTEDEIIRIVEEFNNLCQTVDSEYCYYTDLVKECNDKSNDYNHQLELDNLNYQERAKLATKQKRNLKKRREYKNMVEILEHIIDWKCESESKRSLNLLKQALGRLRKVKKYHGNRSYITRVKE